MIRRSWNRWPEPGEVAARDRTAYAFAPASIREPTCSVDHIAATYCSADLSRTATEPVARSPLGARATHPGFALATSVSLQGPCAASWTVTKHQAMAMRFPTDMGGPDTHSHYVSPGTPLGDVA